MSTPTGDLRNLIDPRVYGTILGGIAAQALIYLGTATLFPNTFYTQNQRAWILTLVACIIMTATSIPFLVQFFSHGGNISLMESLDDNFAVVMASFFVSYLWSDVIVGSFAYLSSFNLWTGWVHHFMYTIIVFISLTFNIPGAFLLACIMELPTAILSIGHLWKTLRWDWGFGITFFTTRLLFLVVFTVALALSFPETYFWLTGLAVAPLNIYWFRGWVLQQWRLYCEKKENDKNGHALDVEVGRDVPNNAPQVALATNDTRDHDRDSGLGREATPEVHGDAFHPTDNKEEPVLEVMSTLLEAGNLNQKLETNNRQPGHNHVVVEQGTA